MHERPATQRRRPRIPSLFSTISNNTPPPVRRPQGPTPPRGRAYRPTRSPRQHPISPGTDKPTGRPEPGLWRDARSTPPARHVTHHSRGRARAQPPKGEQRGFELRTPLHLVQSGADKNLPNTLPRPSQPAPQARRPRQGPTPRPPEVPNPKPVQSAKRAQTASAP